MGSEAEILGPEFTQHVVDSMGPATSPRLRQVMAALITHVHDFARQVQLTNEEWLAGVEFINRAGKMTSADRNEGVLLSDIIGLESLIDNIAFTSATQSPADLTASAILGPFWRPAPRRQNDSSITFDTPPDGQVVYLHGTVSDVESGEPLPGATVDIWQASTNGLYEQQDPSQKEHNLRGIFHTDANGRYALYCLRPTAYPIPVDGPAGQLLQLMDRDVHRPAHIHFIVQAAGHRSLTTQIFDKDCKYLARDSVFAVKHELSVDFVAREGDPRAELQLEYNITLARLAS